MIALRLRRQLAEQIKMMQIANDNTRMVAEASSMAVIMTDRSGTIQYINAATEGMFGYGQAEMIGCNIADKIIPPHLVDQHQTKMELYKKTGHGAMINGCPTRTTGQRADGTQFPIELFIKSNNDNAGRKIVIGFIRDVSEQSAYETNLRTARDEARHHAAAKTMFLAMMSHEMRTPLRRVARTLNRVCACNGGLENYGRTARPCGGKIHYIDLDGYGRRPWC
jgi:PAS domain S-box-containing protein